VEEMSRPCNGTGNSWQISHNWRIVLVFLILVLNLVDLKAIIMEEDSVLGVHTVAKVVSLKNSLELSQELKRVFNACDNFEVLVDVALKLSLH
jgi:hypothetical protein